MAVVQLTKDGKNFFPFDADYLEFCKADGWREAPVEVIQKIALPDLTAAVYADPIVVGAVAPEIVLDAQ